MIGSGLRKKRPRIKTNLPRDMRETARMRYVVMSPRGPQSSSLSDEDGASSHLLELG